MSLSNRVFKSQNLQSESIDAGSSMDNISVSVAHFRGGSHEALVKSEQCLRQFLIRKTV